jgi:hypothetical protein
MLIVWRGFVTYLDNNLRQGKSVNIRKFGAFTFDIETDLPKISSRQISATVDLATVRAERAHIHHSK